MILRMKNKMAKIEVIMPAFFKRFPHETIKKFYNIFFIAVIDSLNS